MTKHSNICCSNISTSDTYELHARRLAEWYLIDTCFNVDGDASCFAG